MVLSDAKARMRWVVKPLVWAGALAPLAVLAARAVNDDLGANPIEEITHWTGLTSLSLLLATLAVTPLRRLTGWNRLIQLRRPIGLFAFFYAVLHFLTYAVLDQGLSLEYVAEDIAERPYITVGTAAFLLLVPLAVTSTRGWIRRLGRNWALLHRLVYAATLLAILHFVWLVKADLRDPLLFGAGFAALMLLRLAPRRRAPAR